MLSHDSLLRNVVRQLDLAPVGTLGQAAPAALQSLLHGNSVEESRLGAGMAYGSILFDEGAPRRNVPVPRDNDLMAGRSSLCS